MIVNVNELRLSRGRREVLRGVSFAADRSELVALMGLSGGGKTTILRTIAALEPFDSGTVDVGGVVLRPGANARQTIRELRKQVGMVFQLHYLFEHLTALQNVTLAPTHVARVANAGAETRAMALLASLDPARRYELGETLVKLTKDGRPLLVTTHDDDFAREFATRVIILAEGEIVEHGDPREVLTHPQHPATKALRSEA